MINYLTCSFTKQTLSNLVKESFGSDFPLVFSKKQVNYVVRYLSDLDAQSVLLEKEYIDKDFLEDHARYYVKCFNNAGHKCARLHFFTLPNVGHDYIDTILADGISSPHYEDLKKSYLGFIVIKPLPKTFIGRTCLKRYPSLHEEQDNRKSLFRTYKVDLFGIPLEVDSIAFQEQDRVVSACATTAIWSALHAITWRDSCEIPACSEITTNAINHIDNSNNNFPNNGLTNKQIMRALDVEGLRHHSEMVDGVSISDFFETVRCYIDSGIPLILGLKTAPSSSDQPRGGHAITILGYKDTPNDLALYIHDDRLGPFVKATFADIDKNLPERKQKWGISLHKKNEVDNKKCQTDEILFPDIIIVPTYRKVRIPHSMVSKTCKLLLKQVSAAVLNSAAKNKLPQDNAENALSTEYQFSLQLRTISSIRHELIRSCPQRCNSEQRLNFLSANFAKYQWVAAFKREGEPVLRMLFDATDIPQGNALSTVLIDNHTLSEPLLIIIKKLANENKNIATDSFYGSVLKHFRPCPDGYDRFLDMTYGKPRAPKYLKAEEFPNGDIVENKSVRTFYRKSSTQISSYFERATKLLWVIADDGALLLGLETDNIGHPSLTGFKPARICGELLSGTNGWTVNNFSGRYSRDYSQADQMKYLNNVIEKMTMIFSDDHFTHYKSTQ